MGLRTAQPAEFLAQIHEGFSVGSLAGTLDLLGEPLELVEQRPGSLSAGLDGALPVSEPLKSASFRLAEVDTLQVSPFAEPLSPGVGGLPGQAAAVFGGRMTLAGPRDLPAIPLPDDVGTFPASTLENAAFDVALRDLSLQLSSPDAISVTGGGFDAGQTVGNLAGSADVNGHLTLGFDTFGKYLTAATMLNVLKGLYPDILTSVDGNLARRELAIGVQSRLDLAGQALQNDTTSPGSYQLVGIGPAIRLPWLTSVDETLLEGVASVSLRISGLAVAPAPGDATGDGAIDLSDFGVLKSNFGKSANLAGGDLNGDGQVTLDDFGILKTQFGATAAAAAVPEPTSLTLLAIAGLVAGLGGVKRGASGLGRLLSRATAAR
ncbi:MAG: hypothetical protein U0836_02250 [Pirellulales bacterium]